MKRLLIPLKQWLAVHPRLRRKLTLIAYRFPALDMCLRRLFHPDAAHRSARITDAGHLAQSARIVMARIRARTPSP